MDGQIRYDEFLLAIRGPMMENRRKIVADVFRRLDADKSGFVTVAELRKCFDATKHPDFERKTRGQDDIFEEFADGVDAYYRIKGFSDGKMSAEEFLELYSFISFAIKDDAVFSKILNNCFTPSSKSQTGRSGVHRGPESNAGERTPYSSTHRKGGNFQENSERYRTAGAYERPSDQEQPREDPYGATGRSRHTESSQSNSRYGSRRDPEEVSHKSLKGDSPSDNLASPSRVESSLSVLRKQLLRRGPMTLIQLRRQFKIMDDNNDGCISFPEFVKGLRDFGLNLSEADYKTLFISIDRHATQKLSIDDFCREIVGQMNPKRTDLIDQVFTKLDTGKHGKVTLMDIKHAFTARGHPEVKSGSKTQDEVLGEFFNTLETHMVSRSFKKDQRLTREDFRGYYTNISAYYENDDDFEIMIRNCWKMPTNPALLPMRRFFLIQRKLSSIFSIRSTSLTWERSNRD